MTARPGLAAEPQQSPPSEEGLAPPLAVTTSPVLPPRGPDEEAVSEARRFNLWPLLYYRHDPLRETTE
ncbi:MAG: hypothetical protein ACE5KY_06620, partial [Candidatus Tectimicrobiota bacterium]